MAKLLNCVFKITSNVINLDESGKPDGDIENDEFSVLGTLKTESRVTTLKYKEERDGAKILCEISADGDEVKVARRGDVVCDMIFSISPIAATASSSDSPSSIRSSIISL